MSWFGSYFLPPIAAQSWNKQYHIWTIGNEHQRCDHCYEEWCQRTYQFSKGTVSHPNRNEDVEAHGRRDIADGGIGNEHYTKVDGINAIGRHNGIENGGQNGNDGRGIHDATLQICYL